MVKVILIGIAVGLLFVGGLYFYDTLQSPTKLLKETETPSQSKASPSNSPLATKAPEARSTPQLLPQTEKKISPSPAPTPESITLPTPQTSERKRTYKIAIILFVESGTPLTSYVYTEGGQRVRRNIKEMLFSESPITKVRVDLGKGFDTFYHSFHYYDDWINSQFSKHGIDLRVLPPDVFGPYVATVKLSKLNRATCGFEVLPLFSKEARSLGINLSPYDSVSYVYYHRDPDGINVGCAWNKEIFSRVFFEETTTGSALRDLDQSYTHNMNEAVEILIHENLHILGAFDHYAGTGNVIAGCSEKGLIEPNKTPKYPQSRVDIMCGKFMTSGTGSQATGGPVNDIVAFSLGGAPFIFAPGFEYVSRDSFDPFTYMEFSKATVDEIRSCQEKRVC